MRSMTRPPLLSAVALALACWAGAAPQPALSQPAAAARASDYIVAVVNSEPITNQEVQYRIARVVQQARQQQQQLPPQEVLARQVLEAVILERVQLQQAREQGLRVDEAAINLGEQNVARQNGFDVAELHRRLELDGIGVARFRNEIRDQILITRLREREMGERVQVSAAEVEQFMREQQAAAGAPPSEINLAHLLVAVPEGASAEQVAEREARARDMERRARAGEDFAALVRAYSDAPDAAGGGAFGLRAPDRYPELFVRATAQLPVGGITAPVRSGAGFHIIKVLDKQQGGALASVTQQRARHILLRPGPQLTEAQARERLAGMKQRIESGQADFAALARASSQDGSAAEGGDLGWANPGQFVPEFEDVLDALRPGELSEPIVSRFGVHLIQLMERRAYKLDAAEQRQVARNLVRERKMDEAYRSWLQELRGRAYVEFREPPQ